MSFPLIELGDLFEIQIGKTPSRANQNYWTNGLYNWLSIADMNQGKYLDRTKEKINDLAVKESNIKLIPENTVVLSYKLSIGKVGIIKKSMFTNEAIASLIPLNNNIDINFLYWALQHIDLMANTDRAAMGQTLNKAKLKEIKIPLPPLSEQKRIAHVLDKADELRQKRQQSIEKLDELLQATFIDMFGDPLTNQKNWEISKLVNEIELIQIGPFGTQLHQEDYVENSIPLINPSHIRNGKILPDNKLTVSEEKYHQLPQYHMKTNDVIVGRRGEMGRCAVVTERENGYFCGTGSLFLRMNEKNLNATFLSFILSSNSIKKLLENSSQGVTMANLNKKIVSEIPLIMPNIDLQSKFGEFVDSINLQKQRLKVQSKQQENLFQSLQQRAFNGEL